MDTKLIRNFCIISHIDHGKSTLADRLLEITGTVELRKMHDQLLDSMELEREKGITIKLTPATMYYNRMKNKKLQVSNTGDLKSKSQNEEPSNSIYKLNLIDTPGHVDFTYEVSRSLEAVEGALLLVDATKGIQAQTINNLELAKKAGLVIIPVINKIDLQEARPEEAALEIAEVAGCDLDEIQFISAKTGEGVEKLLESIIEKIPAPKAEGSSMPRALVFDSYYDDFRGVVVYVRVMDGEFSKGEKIRFYREGILSSVSDLGEISLGLKSKERLTEGDIGFMVTTLKNVSQARVGETICPSNITDNFEPLAGYKVPKPVVYAEFYCSDSNRYNDLREALEKLKLNDASLVSEPTSSKAFGFGLKIGFLGLLHLEIIKERLEREFNLELIVTMPTVDIKKTKDGYLEPWARVEVLIPNQYMGDVLSLLESRRGIQKDIRHLEEKIILKYELPLSEVIVDFYDQVKSATSGYGSVNYELIEDREADLVELEILVAKEKVDAFSRLVYRGFVEKIAKNTVIKLKDLIPKQNFEVKIQAVVGGRILASERISPYRKDVTAKLYGGDVTRKKKLLEKQKKGKKKMARIGKVEIPTKTFIDLLKY